ncbi:MAG: HmuY family protein [Bacteroidia bacterium]|nr:HmuY family protein [Bacteroidia bacterium]
MKLCDIKFVSEGRCFLVLIAAVFLLFAACEKQEKGYILPARPNNLFNVYQFNLGENYEDQVYLNFLDSNPVKTTIKCNSWDLAFDCNILSTRIFMNGGKGVLIATNGRGNFSDNINLNQLKWRWDEASGGDSIVFNRWLNPLQPGYDSVYIIDRGAESPPEERYYQFRLAFLFDDFAIDVADIKGKKLFSGNLHKDPGKNLLFFDFTKPYPLNVEPRNNDWHFCFMRYRWIYYEFKPPLLYYVTGININPKTISVAVDSTLTFEDIGIHDIENLRYSNRRDVMGFDWKVYDFNKGKYMVRKYVTYLIKTKGRNASYFKLRFIDFYSSKGVKGSPKFEVFKVIR